MPKGVRKRFLGTGTPHFPKLLRNFDFAEGKSQKSAYFLWFFEKFTQTTVISRKIALWSIFVLNLIFFILSYHLKQNLQEKTQKPKNGIWSKWRRNRPKSTKITLPTVGGVQAGPGGNFGRFRPNFKRLPFRRFWVICINFCFVWKLSI